MDYQAIYTGADGGTYVVNPENSEQSVTYIQAPQTQG
jgi:hypothetical protein